MKKFFPALTIIFIICLSFFPVCLFSQAEENSEFSVIALRCYIYENASFESNKLADGEDEIVLSHGDLVTKQSEENDFFLVTTQNSASGYVYKYYLTSNSSQSVYPVFNASVRRDSCLYSEEIKTSQSEEDCLIANIKKDTRVYVYSKFDDKEKYTAVQVVLDDGSLYNGLMLTKDLNPDGISGLLIVAISLISACVTVILMVVFIKKSKTKKTKKSKEIKN